MSCGLASTTQTENSTAVSEQGRQKATWNRPDRVNLDPTTAGRARRIGILGEKLAEIQLVAHGFTHVRNLNHTLRINHPGADLYAERQGIGHWISVKARNKYTEGGTLNPRYKVDRDELGFLAECERQKPGSRAACVVISFVMSERLAFGGEPPRSYSCYFMLLNLSGPAGILMGPKHLERYECLAHNVLMSDAEDVSDLENIYDRRRSSTSNIVPD